MFKYNDLVEVVKPGLKSTGKTGRVLGAGPGEGLWGVWLSYGGVINFKKDSIKKIASEPTPAKEKYKVEVEEEVKPTEGFNVGDLVKVVADDKQLKAFNCNHKITCGNAYTITNVKHGNVKLGRLYRGWVKPSFIKKVGEVKAPPKTLYILWSPQSDKPLRVKYTTLASAEQAQHDMSRNYPGQDFYIMKAVSRKSLTKVVKLEEQEEKFY